jgi:hypothetical protein
MVVKKLQTKKSILRMNFMSKEFKQIGNIGASLLNVLKGTSYSYVLDAYKIASEQNFDFSKLSNKLMQYQYSYYEAIPVGMNNGYINYTYQTVYYTPTFCEKLISNFAPHLSIKFAINTVYFISSIFSDSMIHYDLNKLFEKEIYETLVLNLPKDGTFASNIQRSIINILETNLPKTTILPWYKEAIKIITSRASSFLVFDPMRAVEGAAELAYNAGSLVLYGQLAETSLHDQILTNNEHIEL